MRIAISRLHFPVTTLGPGKRIGIWFQGCSIHCEGCISTDTWQFGINEVAMNEVQAVLKSWLPQCDGITISGGEPFDQEEALISLLRFLKSENRSTLVYSGYAIQYLQTTSVLKEGLIDVLISEPYDHKQTQSHRLLGSDNQKIHFLSAHGRATRFEYRDMMPQKVLDLYFDNEQMWMAGIPINGLGDFEQAMRKQGAIIQHTQGSIKDKK